MIKSIRLPLAIATLSFATLTMADDIYFGLADGNSDLFSGHPTRAQRSQDRIGTQPGVGDDFDIYRGLGRGNADLSGSFRDGKINGPRPDIYSGFGDNPDLSY